jgi:hypothetical protein
MATERDFELLDDYVANRLSGADRAGFEQKLQADPDLKSEFQIQQRLVKAIKDARVAELKTMLNNVPVSPVTHGGTSMGAKFAIGTFVAGLVATGIYFYFDREEHTAPVEQVTEPDSSGKQEELSQNDATPAEGIVSEEKVNSDKPVVKPFKKPSLTQEPNAEDVLITKPALDVYDPSTETTEDVEEAAGERRSSVKAGAPTIPVEVDRTNKKYTFNYQFKDGKLLLYGPFEKNLYEILEFFSDEKRTAFLYYKNSFYLLGDENEKVKELTAVTDTVLIRKLKEYRGN